MIHQDHPELLRLMKRLPARANFEEGWLKAVELESRFGITVDDVLPGAMFCLVLAAGEAVLRIPLVDDERESGFRAQIAFSGRGGARILAYDVDSCSTLMARVRPGKMLHEEVQDPEAETRICAGLMRALDHAPIPGAIAVEDWYRPFLAVDHAESIPDNLLRDAQSRAGRLLDTSPPPKLLHGDLHHYNLLSDGAGWVSIDPHGVVADPVMETAAFLRNPCYSFVPTPDLMSTRIRVFAEEMGFSAERIRDWGVAHNVLSAWWDPPHQRARTIQTVEAIQNASI